MGGEESSSTDGDKYWGYAERIVDAQLGQLSPEERENKVRLVASQLRELDEHAGIFPPPPGWQIEEGDE